MGIEKGRLGVRNELAVGRKSFIAVNYAEMVDHVVIFVDDEDVERFLWLMCKEINFVAGNDFKDYNGMNRK